jgi:hypothetical protein
MEGYGFSGSKVKKEKGRKRAQKDGFRKSFDWWRQGGDQ